MDIRHREILRAFSVSEENAINFLKKIYITSEDKQLINFIKVINNATYKSEQLDQIINDKK